MMNNYNLNCRGTAMLLAKTAVLGSGAEMAFDGLKTLYTQLLQKNFFPEPLVEFKRMADNCRRAVLAAALALHDAGVNLESIPQQCWAVLLIADDCGNLANQRYFQDYIDFGRVMGRGNLFVNTLTTTQAAEVSIAFAMHGPLYFITDTRKSTEPALKDVQLLLSSSEADAVMLVHSMEEKTAAAVFGEESA